MKNQPRCVILRGIPGSGKSSMADFLASAFVSSYLFDNKIDQTNRNWKEDHTKYFGYNEIKLVSIHSTDEYFVNEKGVYKWEQSKIVSNHAKNYQSFRNSVESEIPLVIVDNTNTTAKEFTKYKNLAESYGYWVSFIVMPHPTIDEAVKRNKHHVPSDSIKKMVQRFE